jgi:hypothetical protein
MTFIFLHMELQYVTEKTVPALRRGHIAALEQLERHESYRDTLSAYDRHLGPRSVYLRPTNQGLVVLSLDHEACRSMIGVGAIGTSQHVVTELPPRADFVARGVEGYLEKRACAKRVSEEERFALRLISHAFSQGLRLPNSDSYFVHQEWRFSARSRIDLLAVNPETGRLLVIELKRSCAEGKRTDTRKGGDAMAQARSYAAALHRDRTELYPYFERLARALARVHSGPPSMQSLRLDAKHVPDVQVMFPA